MVKNEKQVWYKSEFSSKNIIMPGNISLADLVRKWKNKYNKLSRIKEECFL